MMCKLEKVKNPNRKRRTRYLSTTAKPPKHKAQARQLQMQRNRQYNRNEMQESKRETHERSI